MAYFLICIFVLFVLSLLLLGCVFALFVIFVLFVLLCVQNLFLKKNKKDSNCPDELIYITTKFILLLTWFFFNYHILFQLLQFFSIITISFITIFLSQSLWIITIFFITIFFNLFFFITIFFNLFTTCDTIFMKISQRMNFII